MQLKSDSKIERRSPMGRRPRMLLVVSLLLVSLTGCTGLWLLVQDPEGLPCTANGECLAGYVCLQEVCRRAEAKLVGESCTLDSECETRICADAYDPEFCGDQLSCLQIGRTAPDYRCRAACRGTFADVSDQCGVGERCHRVARREENELFCQEGVCDVDSDCGGGNLCVGAFVNDGESGLCARGCNPLRCTPDLGCDDCPQSEASCENVPNELPDRFRCLPPGVARAGAPCDFDQNFCEPGSFCPVDEPNPVCRKYCNTNPVGSAPSCDGVDECNQIAGAPGVGFCR